MSSQKAKPSLYTTLVTVVTLTVVAIMSLHGAYRYLTAKRLIVNTIQQDTQQSILSLEKTIANLIAAYAVNEYELLVATELGRRENLAIIVEDFNMAKVLGIDSYISGKIRNAEGVILDYELNNPEQTQLLKNSYYSKAQDINSAEGEKLGKLRIYSSDHFLNASLNKIVRSTIIDTLAIISLLVSSLFLALRFFFFKPLSDIAKVIINSDSAGIPIDKIPQSNTKELAALTDSMNKMIASIRGSRQQLQSQHAQLQVEKNRFQNVLEGAELGYWDWQLKTGEHIVNERWLNMLGLSRNETQTNVADWTDRIHPDDKETLLKIVKEHIHSGKPYTAEFRMKHHDGEWIWIEGAGAVVEYDSFNQEPLRLCGTHRDITAKKLAEEELKLSTRVFNSTHEGIIITNSTGIIVDVNPAFTDITGYSREEVLAQKPSLLSSGKQSPEFYKKMWKQLKTQGRWHGEIWNRTKQGELFAELLTISSLKNEQGKIQHYVGIFSDITSNKKQQEQLNLLAHYDILTGLPNRALFADRFKQAIAHSKRTQNALAICFMDLDNFKPVNDKYGHETGDQLLVEVSNRIQSVIRDEDTLSRQGGDEFTLLLNDISSVSQCEQTLQRILNALAQPYMIKDYPHKITASIGVTLYPEDNQDIDTLLRHADHAMYQAKLEGRHCYYFFDNEHDHDIIQKKSHLEEIRQALHNNELTLYFQPKVNMATGVIYGAEALLRWQHPAKGMIPPLTFLPFLNGTALECEVGDWVIEQALSQQEQWLKQGINLQISVNIDSFHLQQEDFILKLDAALARHPSIASPQFQLEILESSALNDLQHIRNTIQACQQALGISFALDDFGTGYSSLTHIRSLSADTIKIDQSFIHDLLDDPNDYAIVHGVILLAETFNQEIIAEGVETIEQGLILLGMGCNKAQGYGIAKPMPAADFSSWLADYIPHQVWLDTAQSQQSLLQSKYRLLKLVSQHWLDQFVSNIQSATEDTKYWPISNSNKCHCGIWIKHAYQEQLLPNQVLEALSTSHQQLHHCADEVFENYQSGELETARKGLNQLKEISDQLQSILAACEKH